jgi:hypothetical protein
VPLTSIITRVANLSEAHRDAMFRLHDRHFCNVRSAAFFQDLAEKDWVILLIDKGDLAGFSTLKLIRLPVAGADRLFLFSGDTIVDPAHWQNSTLAGCFGHFMLRTLSENPVTPIYWFLITKGYRTYRFLPVYFNHFYPAWNQPTPPPYAELLHAAASHKFGDAYNPHTGLIHHQEARDRLRPALCNIAPSRLQDPHVRFFLERNPNYHAGDELACIADISRDNLNRYAWRVIEKTAVQWNE